MTALAPDEASANSRPPVAARIAGAPISWGVCEVPGWGFQIRPETVLSQMHELGLAATEFGPEGFLPDDPAEKADVLREYGLYAAGQFVPVVLHDPGYDPLPEVQHAMDALVVAGATNVVIAAATGQDGYDDSRPAVDGSGWRSLLANLDRINEAAASQGMLATLHPHVGTVVETAEETQLVLDGSTIRLCLDTGHMLIGGADPVAFAQDYPHRVGHVHLKDVDLSWAARVRSREASYTEGVHYGMYVPLGQGDVDVATIVNSLENSGYAGWYVLEQDTILPGDPSDGDCLDPMIDVQTSLNHILSIAEGGNAGEPSPR